MTCEAHTAQLRFRDHMHPRVMLNQTDQNTVRSWQVLSPLLLSKGSVAELIGSLQMTLLAESMHGNQVPAAKVIREARLVTRFRATVCIQEAIIRALASACGVEFVAVDSAVLRRLQCECASSVQRASSPRQKAVTPEAVISALGTATQTKPCIIWIRDVKLLKSPSVSSGLAELTLKRDCSHRLIFLAAPHVSQRDTQKSHSSRVQGLATTAELSDNTGASTRPNGSTRRKRSTAIEASHHDDKTGTDIEVHWPGVSESTTETFQRALFEIVTRIATQAPAVASHKNQDIRALLETLNDERLLSVICDCWLPVLQDPHAKVHVILGARKHYQMKSVSKRNSALESAIQGKASQRDKQHMEASRLQESVPQALLEWMRSTAASVGTSAEAVPTSATCYEGDGKRSSQDIGEAALSEAGRLLSKLSDLVIDEPPNPEARSELNHWYVDETRRSFRARNTAQLTTYLRQSHLTSDHGAFGSLWNCRCDLKNHLANSELSNDQIRHVTSTAVNLELTRRHLQARRLRLCQYRESNCFRREGSQRRTLLSIDQDQDEKKGAGIGMWAGTLSSKQQVRRGWCDVNGDIASLPLTITTGSMEAALIEAIGSSKRQMSSRTDGSGPTTQSSALSYDKHERLLAAHVVTPQDVGVSYDSIGGLDAAKDALRQTITFPLKYPHLYSSGVAAEAVKGVLLFGPPGTGKTLLAKAVATEGGASFLSVDASAIENKWLGESEKNAKAVFSLARKLAPCVIFLDEIDSLLSSREHGDDTSHGTLTSVKTTLMQEWDGLRTTSDRVIVIGSTNRPFDLDEAVLRRMPRRVLVDLPDLVTREQILRVTLRSNDVARDVNLTAIAQRLHGYSGSDVKEVCREAVVRVANAQAEELERMPSNPRCASVHQLLGSARDGKDESHLRPVTQSDFEAAISKLTSSVAEHSPEMLRIHEWNEVYGEVGSRRHQSHAGSFLYL
mmetsp:Transcript_8636/g.35521  ORF Transcript_8636/g.35521 Transcript_8636/m.35521 type:complete len:961 (+) Transcript_8636:347-3229(+)